MTGGDRRISAPRFARGVRFRRLDDGSGVLLVPEGVVNLSETAAAIAEFIDGTRSADDIAIALAVTFDAPASDIAADVRELLDGFAAKTWLEGPGGASP
jgi:pyrroloquinoline quinone biosynthesis protein D